MVDILISLGILAICCSIVMLIKAYASDDEQAKADYYFCYNCRCGWCNAVPDDAECRKWRKEHKQEDNDENGMDKYKR